MRDAVKTVAVTAAVGAVLVSLGLAACSAPPTSAASPTVITQAAAESDAQPAGTDPAAFGERRSVARDLVIEVSEPKSITPSDTAYPASKRAVAFDITVTNEGTEDFRTDQFKVSATTDGRSARQVVDSTQGYTGSGDLPTVLSPGKATHLTIAFAAPTEPVAVELRVEPADVAGGTADFAGQA
jgi:hypothetical protein